MGQLTLNLHSTSVPDAGSLLVQIDGHDSATLRLADEQRPASISVLQYLPFAVSDGALCLLRRVRCDVLRCLKRVKRPQAATLPRSAVWHHCRFEDQLPVHQQCSNKLLHRSRCGSCLYDDPPAVRIRAPAGLSASR